MMLAHAILSFAALLPPAGDRADEQGSAVPRVKSIAEVGIDTRYLLSDIVLQDSRSQLVTAKALLERSFAPARGASEVARATTFGDLVAAVRSQQDAKDPAGSGLARLKRERKDLPSDVMEAALELLSDSGLKSGSWSPEKDLRNDGIWFGSLLKAGRSLGVPGSGEQACLVQGAVLVFADLRTIKNVERDYPTYPDRPRASYLEIGMLKNSFKTGIASDLGRFSTYTVRFESDLPFPFSTYHCDLQVLDRVDASGHMRCDVYSASPDFYWLAGCDTYLPVKTSDGRLVAWLVVREFGFDLDGVPDSDDDRGESLRSQLGNIKRDSERHYGSQAMPGTDAPIVVFDADLTR